MQSSTTICTTEEKPLRTKKSWERPAILREQFLVARAQGPDQMRGSIPTNEPASGIGDPFISALSGSTGDST